MDFAGREPDYLFDRTLRVERFNELRATAFNIGQPKLETGNRPGFDIWRSDVMATITRVGMNKVVFWAAANDFIYSRLASPTQLLIADLVPANRDIAAALNPVTFLRDIEARLTIDDDRTTKLLQFQTAVQGDEETPWEFSNSLERKYQQANQVDQLRYVEVFIKGLINKALKLLLTAHNPPIATIAILRIALATTQHQLAQLVKQSPTPPFETRGLGIAKPMEERRPSDLVPNLAFAGLDIRLGHMNLGDFQKETGETTKGMSDRDIHTIRSGYARANHPEQERTTRHQGIQQARRHPIRDQEGSSRGDQGNSRGRSWTDHANGEWNVERQQQDHLQYVRQAREPTELHKTPKDKEAAALSSTEDSEESEQLSDF